MKRETLRVALAIAPDFRLRTSPIDKRIIGRHRAIRFNAHDFAEMVAKVLRLVARGEMLAQRQEQIALGRLRDAAAKMIAARQWTILLKDDFHIIETRRCFIDQLGAGERG